jgi:hypothetical protein
VRTVLLSAFEIQAMLVFTRYSPGAQKNADELVKLPVIDKHDIRFTSLSAARKSLQGWISDIVQDDYGFLLAAKD